MNFILLICSLFFVATVVRGDSVEEIEEKIFEVLKEDFIPCAEEAGLQPSAEHVAKSAMSPEDVGKAYCAYACVMKRRNIMDGDQINADKMKEFFTETFPEKATELAQMIDTCLEEVKGTEGECAVMEKFGNCMEKMEN